MNRKDYIYNLKLHLEGMSKDELQDILLDYEEHFNIGISKGKTEDEISRELGRPKDIAENYKATFNNNRTNIVTENYSPGRNLFLALLLIFINLIFVLPIFLSLAGILIGAYSVAIIFVFVGIFLILGIPFSFFTYLPNPHMLTSISFGIGFITSSILLIIISIYLTKMFYQLSIKYIKWNLKLING